MTANSPDGRANALESEADKLEGKSTAAGSPGAVANQQQAGGRSLTTRRSRHEFQALARRGQAAFFSS